MQPVENGFFLEIPITPIPTGPALYWRMLLARLSRSKEYKAFGDGEPMAHEGGYYLSRLFRDTVGPASVDGIKASYLVHETFGDDQLVNVMGHPKAVTPYSINCLRDLFGARNVTPVTYRDFESAAPDKM
jgi:hypothetical protein